MTVAEEIKQQTDAINAGWRRLEEAHENVGKYFAQHGSSFRSERWIRCHGVSCGCNKATVISDNSSISMDQTWFKTDKYEEITKEEFEERLRIALDTITKKELA